MTASQYTKEHFNIRISEVARYSGFTPQALDSWFNSDSENNRKRFMCAVAGAVAIRSFGLKEMVDGKEVQAQG